MRTVAKLELQAESSADEEKTFTPERERNGQIWEAFKGYNCFWW